MSGSVVARLEAGARRLAPVAGFNHFDDARARRGLRRVGVLAAVAWAVFFATPWLGANAPAAAMVLISAVVAILAGSILNAATANEELATILVTKIQDAERAAKRKPAAVAAPLPAPSAAFVALASPAPVVAAPVATPPAPRMLSQGEIDGRPYTLYSDGSIEMDTAFGVRWFASLDVAHEFIGYRAGAAGPAQQFAARLN
jgi:hypothetical protein